ncbi:hypothetical protein AAC387_Pa01g0445 [Persea americana]
MHGIFLASSNCVKRITQLYTATKAVTNFEVSALFPSTFKRLGGEFKKSQIPSTTRDFVESWKGGNLSFSRTAEPQGNLLWSPRFRSYLVNRVTGGKSSRFQRIQTGPMQMWHFTFNRFAW